MNAPQYGYQPYPAPREGIAITTQFSFLTWLYALLKPKIFLNGYEMPVGGWGRAVYPAPPGQYHVHVYLPYWLPTRAGPADYTVAVAPGQFVELEYKAPLFTFSRGALGPPVAPARSSSTTHTSRWTAVVVRCPSGSSPRR